MKNLLFLIERNKKVLSNVSYLSLLEIFSLLIPIIVYPFVVKILGGDVYGEVVYAQSIISMVVIAISWGLNAVAVKEISANRDNKEYLDYIFSHVFYVKIIFLSMFFLLFLIVNNCLEFDYILYLLTSWVIIYDIFFPVWYFQGMESLKKMACIISISRIVFLVSIFVFISYPEDYLFYPLSNLFSISVSIILGFYIIFIKDNRKIVPFKRYQIIRLMKLGFPVFLSNFSSVYITNFNKILLGNFGGMSAVTVYDFLEKIVSLIRIPSVIIRQSIFAQMSLNKKKDIFPLLLLVSIMNIMFIIFISIWDDFFINVFLGDEFLYASNFLLIYIWVIVFSTLSTYIIYFKLVPYEIKYGIIIMLSIVIYSLIIVLGWFWEIISYEFIISLTVATEIFVAVLVIFLFYNKIYKYE